MRFGCLRRSGQSSLKGGTAGRLPPRPHCKYLILIQLGVLPPLTKGAPTAEFAKTVDWETPIATALRGASHFDNFTRYVGPLGHDNLASFAQPAGESGREDHLPLISFTEPRRLAPVMTHELVKSSERCGWVAIIHHPLSCASRRLIFRSTRWPRVSVG